jgi:hypothetical protein
VTFQAPLYCLCEMVRNWQQLVACSAIRVLDHLMAAGLGKDKHLRRALLLESPFLCLHSREPDVA